MNAVRDACPFCDYAGPNTILWETSAVYVVEPLRQITPGHVLVIPRVHAEDFADDPAVTAEAFRGASEYAQSHCIEDANLITSRGDCASQTVRHIHVHLLPRTWDDSVQLPWNNPHESPSPTHHLYRRAERELAMLDTTLGQLREAEGEMFGWEAFEARKLVWHAKRYLGKVGERLFCNWRDCLHANDRRRHGSGDLPAEDYAGRAIPIGEGEPYFKGTVHTDCLAAMQERR